MSVGWMAFALLVWDTPVMNQRIHEYSVDFCDVHLLVDLSDRSNRELGLYTSHCLIVDSEMSGVHYQLMQLAFLTQDR